MARGVQTAKPNHPNGGDARPVLALIAAGLIAALIALVLPFRGVLGWLP